MRRADQRKFHYIYKITRDDGRYYIGMHSTDVMNDDYFGSGKLITRSIKKHGKERHTKEILEMLPTRDLLKQREKELLTEELRADEMCMNIAPGGGGGFIDAEHQRNAASAAGKIVGKLTGAKNLIASTRKRVATSHSNGYNRSKIGSSWSWSLDKRKQASIDRRGSGNNQFGFRWVNNGKDALRINEAEVQRYLELGFQRGRKIRSLESILDE